MSLVSFYDFYLRSNPLTTKMITNFAICCTGDLICQAITRSTQPEGKKQDWDFVRVARFGTVGACVQTTLLHWYLTRIVPKLKVSEQLIPGAAHRKAANFSLRMTVHLGTLLPFRIGAIFFALFSLQHLSLRKGIEGLAENYLDGLCAAYVYWPFVLTGLYTLVPRRYGNLYFDSMSLFWAVALSYFASREPKKSSQKEAAAPLTEAAQPKPTMQHERSKLTKLSCPSQPSYAEGAATYGSQEERQEEIFIVTPRLPSERRLCNTTRSTPAASPSKKPSNVVKPI